MGPKVYSGISLESDGFTVYRVPDAGFDAKVRELAAGTTVRFRDTRYSHQDAERIRQDVMGMTTTGFDVSSVSIPQDCEVLKVGVRGDLATAKRTLEARFGARVRVEARTVVPVAG
ncbi:hypothetical protein [Embleya sp. NBC_00896]|uniref:hypothetical protein n=1 Tax=Embleya sp. NBC_00896 TaxID=2975961 RepID=UPI00386EE17D|nr:hypothetical protein OG928_26055 [Embleya sp. NBC_00896]